jgi:hypothetical protein
MLRQPALRNRIKVFHRKRFLEIRIPIKKNSTALITMIAASLAWIFALCILVDFTLRHLDRFWFKAAMIIIILGWFALGMAGASFFIWLFFGRERILVNSEFFITDKPLVFFYRRNFYDTAGISNLRTDVEIYQANRGGVWIDKQRTVIKFDTAEKNVTFARGIEKGEAEFILMQLAASSYLDHAQFAETHKL